MIRDFRSIVWKEWREIRRQPGGWMLTGWRSNVAVMLIFGLFIGAMYEGSWWLSGFGVVGFGLMMALTQAGDTFAGERERHTLETLFSTGISESAVLAGKVAAVAAYGWLLSMTGLLTLVVTAEVRGMLEVGPTFPALGVLTVVTIGLLVIVFVSMIGALVSFRSSTVKQAQQTLVSILFALVWLPLLVGGILMLALRADPVMAMFGAFIELLHPVGEMSPEARLIGIAALLLASNLLLFRIARSMVVRERVVLP